MSAPTASAMLLALLVAGCGGAPASAAREPEPAAGSETAAAAAAPPAVNGSTAVAAAPPAPQPPADAQALAPTEPALPDEPVVLNGQPLAALDLSELQAIFGQAPTPGRYWYDPRSGLWGLQAHGAGGATRTGLRVPAPLPADASSGDSGAFVYDVLDQPSG